MPVYSNNQTRKRSANKKYLRSFCISKAQHRRVEKQPSLISGLFQRELADPLWIQPEEFLVAGWREYACLALVLWPVGSDGFDVQRVVVWRVDVHVKFSSMMPVWGKAIPSGSFPSEPQGHLIHTAVVWSLGQIGAYLSTEFLLPSSVLMIWSL